MYEYIEIQNIAMRKVRTKEFAHFSVRQSEMKNAKLLVGIDMKKLIMICM